MLREDLKNRLKGTVLVVGVGNELRGDDGYGPRMIRRLEGRVKVALLDVGEAPENYLGSIVEQQVQTILVLDAAHFGEEVGAAAILEVEDMEGTSVSTHGIPLKLFFTLVREESRADVFALCVQPAQLTTGHGLSPEVEAASQVLSETLIEVFNEAPQHTLGVRSR